LCIECGLLLAAHREALGKQLAATVYEADEPEIADVLAALNTRLSASPPCVDRRRECSSS
jgi:hypothetical protein